MKGRFVGQSRLEEKKERKKDVVNDQIELMNMRCILQLRAMVRVNIRSVRTVSLSDLSPPVQTIGICSCCTIPRLQASTLGRLPKLR